MNLNESTVEDAALEWFRDLGYAVGHGPQLAPGEYAEGTLTPALSHGERESYGEVVLVGLPAAMLAAQAGVADAEKSVHHPERQTA